MVSDGDKESSSASMRHVAFIKAGVEYADASDNGELSENDGAIGDKERGPCGLGRGSSSLRPGSTANRAAGWW